MSGRRVQAPAAAAASHLIDSTDVATALSALFNIGSKEKGLQKLVEMLDDG